MTVSTRLDSTSLCKLIFVITFQRVYHNQEDRLSFQVGWSPVAVQICESCRVTWASTVVIHSLAGHPAHRPDKALSHPKLAFRRSAEQKIALDLHCYVCLIVLLFTAYTPEPGSSQEMMGLLRLFDLTHGLPPRLLRDPGLR